MIRNNGVANPRISVLVFPKVYPMNFNPVKYSFKKGIVVKQSKNTGAAGGPVMEIYITHQHIKDSKTLKEPVFLRKNIL